MADAARKLRAHTPTLHTTESTFDKPKLGDVRIEEGTARVNGEVMRALHQALGPDGKPTGPIRREAIPGGVVVREEQRAFKVYRFEERPDADYFHSSENTPAQSGQFATDGQGFFLDDKGQRIPRYAERGFWAIKGEDADIWKARKIAEKHGAK